MAGEFTSSALAPGTWSRQLRDDPRPAGRPRGRRGGLCPGGTGPVMDAFSRYALVVLGTRADGRHRPGQDGGHRGNAAQLQAAAQPKSWTAPELFICMAL